MGRRGGARARARERARGLQQERPAQRVARGDCGGGGGRASLASLRAIADDLYGVCVASGVTQVSEPAAWILHQTAMREQWVDVRGQIAALRGADCDNARARSFYNYMEFMYVSYPAGFGDAIAAFHRADQSFDGAAVFDYLNF